MADRRIRVPQDKNDFIEQLTMTKRKDSYSGCFELRVDVLTFAAAYGYRHRKRIPFNKTSDPIRLDVFQRKGHDMVMYLLALAETRDPTCLAETDEAMELRATIFEEYANGGLELLQRELKSVDDPLKRILLILEDELKSDNKTSEGEFDLNRFLLD